MREEAFTCMIMKTHAKNKSTSAVDIESEYQDEAEQEKRHAIVGKEMGGSFSST